MANIGNGSLPFVAELIERQPKVDRVVGDIYQVLLSPEVPYSRLNGGMPQQQLDLLKLAARSSAQFGAGATEVVRRDAW
jgi:hypothetical protein